MGRCLGLISVALGGWLSGFITRFDVYATPLLERVTQIPQRLISLVVTLHFGRHDPVVGMKVSQLVGLRPFYLS